MLTEPPLIDEDIISCLKNKYAIDVEDIEFLPLGADFNTLVYRITSTDQNDYFLKLRQNEFSESSIRIPKYLAENGIEQIISPLITKFGDLWTQLEIMTNYTVILYPFIKGNNAVNVTLSETQWLEFGSTIKRIHTAIIPSEITGNIPKETFTSKWFEILETFLNFAKREVFDDPISLKTSKLLISKETEISGLIHQSKELADTLKKQSHKYVLCHGDIHGWNLLVSSKNELYVIDWDTLILAPKERDLMFIGAGIWKSGYFAAEELALFYQGYGQDDINRDALSYYRSERIIQDIGEFCENIFLSHKDNKDRFQSYEYLQSIFSENGPFESIKN